MAKIGTFKIISGELRGAITTLAVQAKSVRIVPDETATGNAPGHRIFAGEAEIGAAWTRSTQDDRTYLSVKLDDPSLVAPIFAQLFENPDGTHDLVWTRSSRRTGE
ncbi:DUF736 domain-containing protein [Novosphingobium sp. 9]|uniref:DUF736 domain-containing protein n=1 Tax=Novosphingobium sp. 9 TaxID=2025349 RepID=UPI0021B5808E|nr:DUF736 domain-containing protein [Novosphingobium sp. 9]